MRVLLVLAVSLSMLAGCSDSGGSDTPAQTASTKEVEIHGSAFHDAAVTIHAGDKVAWHNHDGFAHTATADDGSFDSQSIGSDHGFDHTFSAKGTVHYHCKIHPSMKGSVTVA